MKTSVKWIIGIVVGLFVIVCLAGFALLAIRGFNGSGLVLGTRMGQFWNGQRSMPFGNMPFRDMPWGVMPMRPYRGFFGGWNGLFSPLRFIAFPLLCLGFLALVILGIIALIRSQSRPKPAAAAVTPAVAPMAEPNTTVEQSTGAPVTEVVEPTCPNCGQPVQRAWKHCPNCGAPLT
jgi:Na+-transporting methylmalonyl-CoA/oxaloacetate decarboxylase gamma subunit